VEAASSGGSVIALLTLIAALDVGAPAPAVPQTDFAKHKLTVVMFVSTTCPVSNAYNDRMKQIAADYAKKDVAFVGVDANKQESGDDIAKFTKDKGFAFPWLKDDGNKVADQYNARVTPEVFVVDAKGVVKYHGRIDEKMDGSEIKSPDLKNALDAILAGKDAPAKETKAFGCSIKRL
jgi:thiol-disulfide isomerase/thioredoxin